MIVAENLTKRYGARTAVSDASFAVRPGMVTGFLGPNGAGKSTTMRMIVGLDRPTSGRATVNGRAYATSPSPLTEVGTLLDAKAVHTGRSARNHLRAMAATHGIPVSRVDEVLEITGIASVARKRAGGFSLGMGQRLGIASAILGDPTTLILDEPVNGLDPEGVRWVRDFVRSYAAAGRTVLLSSHLMSEMALTADHLIVLGRGRVLADASVAQLVAAWTKEDVAVETPHADALASALASDTVTVQRTGANALAVSGAPAAWIGDRAAAAGIAIHQLTTRTGSLEEAYMALTGDAVEYKTKELA
ncbi:MULTISPECIES: ABC transporter ATP-binding protein [Microbacterium]|uniref:ABC transporter ATP-binding protein n=1 Tax=Microbacterium TaxID=33882 RepID=UPI001E461D1C|nr:ATP-binding cassette domain-containing protein [Microbacterium nymphoidis]MCD2497200.1 ATP-binding cassette domain-containing protein [Microbacterium nymphoidis]